MQDERQAWPYRTISIVTGIFFTIVICFMIFAQDYFSSYYSQSYRIGNAWLFFLATGCIFLFVIIVKRMRWKARRIRFLGWLGIYFPLLLIAQMVFIRSVWYYPGFDVVNIYTNAQLMAEGGTPAGDYFRLCPNNASITVLQVLPLWIALKLGLAVPYAVLPYVGAMLANLTLLFSVLCVAKITPNRAARLGALLLGTTWIAFSMLITVPYTDIFSILFPVLALYLYLSSLRALPKWFFISFTCFLGESMKPTVMIFFIALVIFAAIQSFTSGKWTGKRVRRIGLLCLIIVLGALPGILWQTQSTVFMAGSAKPQEQLSKTHYLMLGMNGETYGGHSPDDVAFSTSYTNLADREKANLQRAWDRFSNRGFGRNVHFFSVKAYKAFSDGMMAADQSFLMLEIPTRTDALSVFLRRIFYKKGDLHTVLTTVEQGIWIGILALCVFAMFFGRRRKITGLLSLTLLGLAAYLLLFEVWPRYIFLYAPFFVILASLGLERLSSSKGNNITCAARNGLPVA